MNHAERLELIAALKAAGVSHYKSHDLEIQLGSAPATTLGYTPPTLKTYPEQNNAPAPAAPVHAHIPPELAKRVQEMTNLIGMPPEQLANQIFPEGAE